MIPSATTSEPAGIPSSSSHMGASAPHHARVLAKIKGRCLTPHVNGASMIKQQHNQFPALPSGKDNTIGSLGQSPNATWWARHPRAVHWMHHHNVMTVQNSSPIKCPGGVPSTYPLCNWLPCTVLTIELVCYKQASSSSGYPLLLLK